MSPKKQWTSSWLRTGGGDGFKHYTAHETPNPATGIAITGEPGTLPCALCHVELKDRRSYLIHTQSHSSPILPEIPIKSEPIKKEIDENITMPVLPLARIKIARDADETFETARNEDDEENQNVQESINTAEDNPTLDPTLELAQAAAEMLGSFAIAALGMQNSLHKYVKKVEKASNSASTDSGLNGDDAI